MSRRVVAAGGFRARDLDLTLEPPEADLGPDRRGVRPVADTVLERLRKLGVVRTAEAAGDPGRPDAGAGPEDGSAVHATTDRTRGLRDAFVVAGVDVSVAPARSGVSTGG